MASTEALIHLYPAVFGPAERTLVERGPLRVAVFRFDSGVEGLRLENELGHLVMLPFQGQQIWSARFGGRELTMRSMFDQPRPTRAYLENYGGFLLHCGATAMGVPGPGDTHPLHGELPNAPFQRAWVVLGEDEKGEYLALGGQYQHTVAFTANYVAEPLVKLYAGSSLFEVSMTIANLRRAPMELMYLAHANFRPVNGSRLVYSARCTPEHVRVRRNIPAHVRTDPGFIEFLDELGRHPDGHEHLTADQIFDPEMVFYIDYLADEQGWAHTLQVLPDGSADYVRHRPEQLGKGVRWICRTGDQDALGMVLPATAEPEGYAAEKAKGNLVLLPPQGRFHFDLEMGTLSASAAGQVAQTIARLVAG
jgi:hypothetical protein